MKINFLTFTEILIQSIAVSGNSYPLGTFLYQGKCLPPLLLNILVSMLSYVLKHETFISNGGAHKFND